MAVINIFRDNQYFIPDGYDDFKGGDEINILVKKDAVYNTISAFCAEKPSNERVLMFGGNPVSKYISQRLERDDSIITTRIIEENLDMARNLAKDLTSTIVIQGEMLSDVILDEADISHIDAAIAITDNDKDNLLSSLLAAKRGVSSTISLVNTPSYNNLILDIGNSILIDKRSVTMSKLLKELRITKLEEAYAISRGNGEIWEIKIDEDEKIIGKKIGELNLPKQSRIFAISRGGDIIYPDLSIALKYEDSILLYVDSAVIRQAENIFS